MSKSTILTTIISNYRQILERLTQISYPLFCLRFKLVSNSGTAFLQTQLATHHNFTRKSYKTHNNIKLVTLTKNAHTNSNNHAAKNEFQSYDRPANQRTPTYLMSYDLCD